MEGDFKISNQMIFLSIMYINLPYGPMTTYKRKKKITLLIL